MKNLFDFFKPDEGTKLPEHIINGRADYKFRNGLICYQEELDTEQSEKLLNIMMSVDADKISFEGIKVAEIVRLLLNEKLLHRVIDIILIPNSPSSDISNEGERISAYKRLKNSEVIEVLRDFFSLNVAATEGLKTFVKDLTTAKTTPSI